jgi:thiosulfate sulfurtransferase
LAGLEPTQSAKNFSLWTARFELDKTTASGQESDMEIPQIPVHEAKQKLDEKSCLFVDIRDPASYRQAHIPGAIQLNDGNVQAFLQNTDKEQAVVVYCYHGNSSLGATAFLIENGFKNVASMSGGFEAWRPVYEHEAD